MPRAIILHAGFHKTGTSSVQQTLRAHRAALKPYLALRLKPQMTELLHAARGYSTWRDKLTLMKLDRRFRALLNGLPGMPRRALVLSAEELSGHMPGRGDLLDYSAAPILAERYARACAAQFPGTPVLFCFGTRAPEAWLASAWAEHVKSSSMTLDRDAFCAEYAGAAAFASVLDEVAARTGCAVHRVALEEHGTNPSAPLMALAGVPEDVCAASTPPGRINARLPDGVLLDLLAANRAYADRDARKAAKAAILKAAGYE